MARGARRDPHVAWPVKALVALAVGWAGVAAVNEVTGRDDADQGDPDTPEVTREGSRRVGGPDRAWSFNPFPPSYELTYDVNASGSASIEVLRVLAPFESRVESRTGPEPAGKVLSQRETAFGVLATKAGDGPPTVLAVPPALGGPRLAEAVLSAEPLGLVERREVRSVAGRRCQVWRTGDALGATTFLRPGPRDFLDLCVDRDGLLLEEWQVSGGRPVRHRAATEVELRPVDPTELTTLPRDVTLDLDDGGGSTRQVGDDDRPPGPFLELPAPPSGFDRRGRFSVVPPQPGLREGGERGKLRAATVDVFVRGVDAIIVEQGGVLDLSDPWTLEEALPDIDLGPSVGTGELVPGRLGSEVRALLGSGRYLRLAGSVPLDDLIALARSMTLVDDGRGVRIED